MPRGYVIVEIGPAIKVDNFTTRYDVILDGEPTSWWIERMEGDEDMEDLWSAHALWPGDPMEYRGQNYWDNMVGPDWSIENARQHVIEQVVREAIAERKEAKRQARKV